MSFSPSSLSKYWRDHSLTIFLTLLGIVCTVVGIWYVWPLDNDRKFDLWTGAGLGIGIIALFNWLSGPLREKNKPEKP